MKILGFNFSCSYFQFPSVNRKNIFPLLLKSCAALVAMALVGRAVVKTIGPNLTPFFHKIFGKTNPSENKKDVTNKTNEKKSAGLLESSKIEIKKESQLPLLLQGRTWIHRIEALSVKGVQSLRTLKDSEVEELLRVIPGIDRIKIDNGDKYAIQGFIEMNQVGIQPKKNDKNQVQRVTNNEKFLLYFQYVISYIYQMKDPREKKNEVQALLESAKHCPTDLFAYVERKYKQWALGEKLGFEVMAALFIEEYRETVITEVFSKAYTSLEKQGLIQKNNSRHGEPHLRNTFLVVYGKDIQYRPEAALNDWWAYPQHPSVQAILKSTEASNFEKNVNQSFSMENLIRLFIEKMNGDPHSSLSITFFNKWCGEKNINSDASTYDEKMTYPAYFPKIQKAHTDFLAPYITEELAIEVFEKLGYIK